MWGKKNEGTHVEGSAKDYQRRLPSKKKVMKPNMKDVEAKLKEKRGSKTMGPSSAGGHVPTAADIEARRLEREEEERRKRKAEFADQRAQMLSAQNAKSFSRKNGQLTDHPGGSARW